MKAIVISVLLLAALACALIVARNNSINAVQHEHRGTKIVVHVDSLEVRAYQDQIGLAFQGILIDVEPSIDIDELINVREEIVLRISQNDTIEILEADNGIL